MRVMHRLIAVVALIACSRARSATDLEECQKAVEHDGPATVDVCKRAWDQTHDVAAAVAGARLALMRDDYASLKAWAALAPPNVEGARILHFWGEMQGAHGELDGAEATLRRALELRLALDPLRAWNTALVLFRMVRNRRPPAESIGLAYTAWEQANRAGSPTPRAMTAAALAEILIDLGELKAAELVIERIPQDASPVLHKLSMGRLEGARSHVELATALFQKATEIREDSAERAWRFSAHIELVRALLHAGRVPDARKELGVTAEFAQHADVQSTDLACKLAAAGATVALAEGNLERALDEAKRGLTLESRDAARVELLNVRGDALARSGKSQDAERAWRDAADQLEVWRASIPSVRLRSGLVTYHRHALEAWLDSAAARGDAAATIEVVQRIVGRGLLDRMRDRESNTGDPIQAVQDVTSRLAARGRLTAQPRIASARPLRDAPHDLVAILSGEQIVWAIRRVNDRWTIDRVGNRAEIVALVDAYRSNPDDSTVATRLGTAMFPVATLPQGDQPLVVVLDRELGDVALAGLRTGGRFLVEHAPIMELLVPDLIFAEPHRDSWSTAVAIGDPTGNLPGAKREVVAVARALSAVAATGPAATRKAVIDAAAARTLHIATHSTVDGGRAAFVLADGVITAFDIVNLNVAPRLAVIATCRSHVDDDPEQSLVAAFLAAGSSGVVGVKRAVDDAYGEQLIADFYSAHGDERPAEALATAQRDAIHAGRPPHLWAAFSFFGTGVWLSKVEVRK
jgi:tetratricopeptide (TPR) repeat protein